MIERMGEDLEQLNGEHDQSTSYSHTKFSKGKGAWKEGRMDLRAVVSLEPQALGRQRQEDPGSLLSSPPNQLVSSSQLQ